MPIVLYNSYTGTKQKPLCLTDLVSLQLQGYSVVKTPHIGNQHPSNLLCAALGFQMDMVTFTSGMLDKNFHPHLRIKDGVGTPLYDVGTYTPFALVHTGQSSEEFHQTAVKKIFPRTVTTTDMELIAQDVRLAETVMRTATKAVSHLWYRQVSREGIVRKAESPTSWNAIASDIFRFSSEQSGWVIPNKVHILFTLAWQALSSGRDCVYTLSGPNMIHYIGGLQANLSTMYEALRQQWPGLPEVLTVYVVPVAQCRLLSHQSRADDVNSVLEVIAWYERQADIHKQAARSEIERVAREYPDFTRSIAEANFLTQYDLEDAGELFVPTWLLETPLGRIQSFATSMAKGVETAIAAQ